MEIGNAHPEFNLESEVELAYEFLMLASDPLVFRAHECHEPKPGVTSSSRSNSVPKCPTEGCVGSLYLTAADQR